MRQEPLTGFVLHQRAYKEKNRLIYFFSKEHGVIHGIGPKSLNPFQHYSLYATGKNQLKRFTQVSPLPPFTQLSAQALYAGLYLNELLYHVLPKEDVSFHTFFAYQHAIEALATPSEQSNDLNYIKLQLRRVEYNLLGEMGYGVDFSQDTLGQAFDPQLSYRFDVMHGFTACTNTTKAHATVMIEGNWLANLDITAFTRDDTKHLGVIFRHCIDHMLEYKPLRSRDLWQSLYATETPIMK